MKTLNERAASGMPGRDLLIGLILLGSVWGFLEVGLGGAMKAGDIPYKGDILTGLGIGLMAVGLAIFRKPLMLVGIAATAVMVKQLAVPVLGLSFICKANSCLAVMLGGSALAGSAAIAGGNLAKGRLSRVATGFSAGLLAGVGFYFIGMRVAPCRYLLSFNRSGGFVAFMGAEGIIWATLGAVCFPAGYAIGERLGESISGLRVSRPAVYYTASGVIIGICWLASALAIAGGI
jgi:hypothetical protein